MRLVPLATHILPIALFAVLAAGSTDTGPTTSSPSATSTPLDTSWIPAGYSAYDDNVAYKFRESGQVECGYRNSCYQLELVSKNGCNNLYVELTRLGSSGENVGFTNDTTSNLLPKQKAVLTFSSFDDDKTARVSKINCY
jgi:hypothetical protein